MGLYEKGGGRSRVMCIGRLAELLCHLLVAHKCLVLAMEIGQFFLEPAADSAVASDHIAVLVKAKTAVDEAGQIDEKGTEM